MRTPSMVFAVLAAVALPTASHAQFTLGFRSGFAPAMGEAYSVNGSGAKMSDVMAGQVATQLDAAFRITPEVALGAYASYGFGVIGGDLQTTCDDYGLDCTAQVVRVGLQATYSFTRLSPRFVPWLGVGFGWEWAGYRIEGTGTFTGLAAEENLDGWELTLLQLGGDWRIGRVFALGPYVAYSLGQYTSGTVEATGDPTVHVFDQADHETHQWLSFGVRGKFDFGAR